jgi:hypothetical protein
MASLPIIFQMAISKLKQKSLLKHLIPGRKRLNSSVNKDVQMPIILVVSACYTLLVCKVQSFVLIELMIRAYRFSTPTISYRRNNQSLPMHLVRVMSQRCLPLPD